MGAEPTRKHTYIRAGHLRIIFSKTKRLSPVLSSKNLLDHVWGQHVPVPPVLEAPFLALAWGRVLGVDEFRKGPYLPRAVYVLLCSIKQAPSGFKARGEHVSHAG